MQFSDWLRYSLFILCKSNCPLRVLAQTAKTRGGTIEVPAYRRDYFAVGEKISTFVNTARKGLPDKGLYFAGCFLLLPVSEKNRDSKFQMIYSAAVRLSRYLRSHNKKNSLFHYQIQTAELFDIIFCFSIIF